jgi:thioredoxin 1
MANVPEVTDATFRQEVLDSTVPVLVDFWAPWCGPCRMVSPLVEELAGEFVGKVSFVKLNTDDNPATATSYGIRSIPTLMIFKAGQPVGQVVGFRPKAEIKKHIDSALS